MFYFLQQFSSIYSSLAYIVSTVFRTIFQWIDPCSWEWCLVIFTFIEFFFPPLSVWLIFTSQRYRVLSKFLFQVEMAWLTRSLYRWYKKSYLSQLLVGNLHLEGLKNSPQLSILFKNVNADISRLKYKSVGLISN